MRPLLVDLMKRKSMLTKQDDFLFTTWCRTQFKLLIMEYRALYKNHSFWLSISWRAPGNQHLNLILYTPPPTSINRELIPERGVDISMIKYTSIIFFLLYFPINFSLIILQNNWNNLGFHNLDRWFYTSMF